MSSMFLCSKCHDPACTMHFSGSTGPCEGCGKTAQCVDCRNMAPPKKRKKTPKPPKPKPAPKVLTKAEEQAVRLFGVGAGVAYRVTSKAGYGRRKFVPMERIWATLDAARAPEAPKTVPARTHPTSAAEKLLLKEYASDDHTECNHGIGHCQYSEMFAVLFKAERARQYEAKKNATCDSCGRKGDIKSCGKDYNGDSDAPDLCFLCRKKEGL